MGSTDFNCCLCIIVGVCSLIMVSAPCFLQVVDTVLWKHAFFNCNFFRTFFAYLLVWNYGKLIFFRLTNFVFAFCLWKKAYESQSEYRQKRKKLILCLSS